MTFDAKTVRRLLEQDDETLLRTLRSLAAKTGIDLSDFSLSTADAAALRRGLSSLSDEDLARAAQEYAAYRAQINRDLRQK